MATNTSRLGLLKKDTATDGNDTFNIKTMLNDNWDLIDAKVATLGVDGKVPADQLSISVNDASTTQKGVVMLEDSVTSASVTKAATPKSVKTVNDALDAHKAGLVSQESGKGASLVGINDTANQFTATNVEGALSELFTFASNGKSGIATAIADAGGAANSNMTFAQLAALIPTITGTKTATIEIAAQSNMKLVINGLDFKPKWAIGVNKRNNWYMFSYLEGDSTFCSIRDNTGMQSSVDQFTATDGSFIVGEPINTSGLYATGKYLCILGGE